MIVVSDTSPLIHLATIGRLELLRELYGEVHVPKAVFEEATRELRVHPDGQRILDVDWLRVHPVMDNGRVERLMTVIDRGEAEALVLAQELGADVLLIDDGKGRNLAQQLNLKLVGLLGVLIAAKKAGLIPLLKEIIGELETRASVWWSEELKTRALFLAGEGPG